MLIVDERVNGTLVVREHLAEGTRLGAGLGASGRLAADAVARTLAVARRFAAHARAEGAELTCIATSAMRRARDADEFAVRLATELGVAVRILSGDDEARLSFIGATHDAPADGRRIAVLDIGGGSTECAVGVARAAEHVRSFEVGSVRVSERFPPLCGGAPGEPARVAAEAARHMIRRELAELSALGPLAEVRAVAGTPLTLGAIAFESEADRVAGRPLSRALLAETLERLLALDLDARRALPGMIAQRADVVVGGGLVLDEALRLLEAAEALLEDDDLLLGAAMELRRAQRGDGNAMG
ncbi:MAG: Ppx/GppA family phosphatase [Vulcanimicrobiaceae bacterium]